MATQRNHNEWFRTVLLGNRKSCPNCKVKLGRNQSIWAWGNYIRAKWHNVKYFCRECYRTEVADHLLEHAGECGCSISLVGYHCSLPKWLKLVKRRVCKIKTPVVVTPPMAETQAA